MAQEFRPSRFEMRKLRKAVLEHAKLNGRVCKLVQPKTRTLNKYTTSDVYDYTGAIEYPYYIHFQAEPPKKMLELFGWSKESTDAKPLLADCPMYRYPMPNENQAVLLDIDGVRVTPAIVSEGCLLKVETYDWTLETTRIESFEVEKVLAGDDKINYVVSLVAHRLLDSGADEADKPDSGSRFIKQSDE
jgi:hypothetical protein